jgi:hypothetical protein
MMPKRINDPAESPTMFLPDGDNLGRASRQRAREDGIGVRNRQDHSNRTAPERLGAEVAVLGRLIA